MSTAEDPLRAPARAVRDRTSRRRLRWLLGSALLAPLVAELALRAVGGDVVAVAPGPYDCSLRSSSTGEVLTAEQGPLEIELCPQTSFRLRPGCTTPLFHFNAEGCRGPELEPRRAGRRRIVLLGASTTFGLGLAADAETIPAQLQSLLADSEVVNAGVPGFLSGQILCQLVTHILGLAPDVVVFLDGWSDCHHWWVNPTQRTDVGFNCMLQETVELLLTQRANAIRSPWSTMRFGAVAALQQTAIARALARRTASVGVDDPPGPAGPDGHASTASLDPTFAVMREQFVRHLLTMRDVCRARDIRFVAALQPELGTKERLSPDEQVRLHQDHDEARPYATSFVPGWRRFVADVRSECARSGLEVLDVGADAQLREDEATCFWDLVHPNAHGAALVASMLATVLR